MQYLIRLQVVVLFVAALVTAACRQQATQNREQANRTSQVQGNADAGFRYKKLRWIEDFSGSKPAYEAAIVPLETGNWLLSDAMIAKDGISKTGDDKAARIRNNGKLSMQFDVQGADTVTIRHALYGQDEPSGWQLWMSADGGATYHQTGSTVFTKNIAAQKSIFIVQKTGWVRFEIRKINGGRNRVLILDMSISQGKKQSNHSEGNVPEETKDNIQLLLGNPTGAMHSLSSPDNFLIDHTYYVESYNKSKCTPNWVSWHVDASTWAVPTV